jgi:hypothetical protein
MALIVQDANRQWGLRAGRPRLIRDIELVDIFSLKQRLPTSIWKMFLAVFDPTILESQPRPGTQTPLAREIMRDMLSLRLMNFREHHHLAQKFAELRHAGRDASILAFVMRQVCNHIFTQPHMFPALLTNRELYAFLGLSQPLADWADRLDFFSSLGGAAVGGIKLVPGLSGATAGTGVAIDGVERHYGSLSQAYTLELARRGFYVR